MKKILKEYFIKRKFKKNLKENLKEFSKLKLTPFNGGITDYFKMIYIEINALAQLIADCMKQENGFEEFTLEDQTLFLSEVSIHLHELTCIRYEYEYRNQDLFQTPRVITESLKVIKLMEVMYEVIRRNRLKILEKRRTEIKN